MQVGASAAILTSIGVVATEAALVASASVILYAGMHGFKILRRAF
ncbi:MAG: major capsid protein [Gallionella sp.]|nr:major capsid protein [Gallionella sp.]